MLLLNPSEMSADYSYNCIPMIDNLNDIRIFYPFAMYLFISFAVVFALYKFARTAHKIHLIVLFSWTFLIFSFLPASNLFLYVGTLVGERLLYLPSIGYCYLFAILWFFADDFLKKLNWKFFQFVLVILFLLYIVWFCSLTYQRNYDWKNEETLFQSAMQVCNNSAKVQEVFSMLFCFMSVLRTECPFFFCIEYWHIAPTLQSV